MSWPQGGKWRSKLKETQYDDDDDDDDDDDNDELSLWYG